jgi:hypothetical protein
MPIDVPAGLRTGFFTEITVERTARIHLVKDGVSAAVQECNGDMLGRTAAELLRAAQQISPFAAGTRAPSIVGLDLTDAIVPATSVALSSNPEPNLSTLVVRVGEAVVGFALPNESLRELGQAFLAASAAGQSH